MDQDDHQQGPTLRADFRPVSQLIDRAVVYAEQFRTWNHQDWPHLKNEEDFDKIFDHPTEEHIPVESVYATGRDLAISVESALYAFADVGKCPTFRSYVDGVEEFVSGWAAKLRSTVERAEPIFAKWPQYYSVREMFALATEELAMADAIRDWAGMAKRSGLYRDEAGPSAGANSTTTPATPARTDARFDIQEMLGGGNFGEVHKAFDRKMKRTVALKYVPQGMGDGTALAHAQAMSRLNHPNVAVVHEVLEDQHQPDTHTPCDAVVMELVDGSSLEDRLRAGPLSSDEVPGLCRGLVSAVDYFQSKRFVHGDLHEGNVMLASEGPKIIDVMFDTAGGRSTATMERRLLRDIQSCRDVLARALRSAQFDADSFLQETWAMNLPALRGALERVLEGGGLTSTARAPDKAFISQGRIPPAPTLHALMAFRTTQRHKGRHDYELVVTARNTSTKTIRQWHIDLEIPTALLDEHTTYGALVRERSNAKISFLRMDERTRKDGLRPGDDVVMRVQYRVDDAIFRARATIFTELVRATVYADDALATVIEKSVEELQNF